MTSAHDQLRRPMEMGQIIDRSLALYRQNFGDFLAIAAVTLPIDLISAIVSLAIPDQVVALLVTLPMTVASIIVSIIATAAIARAIADIADDLPTDFNRAYRRVLVRLGDLLLAALRAIGLVILISFTIIGIPFAIYLAIRWAFFSQAVVIENQPAREALSLSSRIVEGSWWRTFGILVTISVLAALPALAVSIMFTPAAAIASALASAVVAVVVLPFIAGASTLLFFDLHSREREHVSTN